MLERIDHIAIAVEDLEAALALYQGVFGVQGVRREVNEADGFEVAAFQIGETAIELLVSRRPDSVVATALAKRGPGLHHVAFQVADVAEAAQCCCDQGLKRIDAEPRPGTGGSRIVFLHPKSTGGTLIELVEPGTGQNQPGKQKREE
jgi:methylmalonyl-CoA/ethylmalonyl-CoA epimerase